MKKIRVTCIVQQLHELLSESGLNEVAHASDELPQGSHAIAELLDLAPRNFHAHVVVAVFKLHPPTYRTGC